MPDRIQRLLIPLLLLLAACLPAQAADQPLELWQKGVTAYEAGQYQQAVSAFQQIEATQLRTAPLQLNLGNSHYHAGNPGRAALHYERALRIDPRSSAARHNLQLLRAETGAPADDDHFFLFVPLIVLYRLLAPGEWLLLLAIAHSLTGIAAALWILLPPALRPPARNSCLALLAATILLAAFALPRYINAEHSHDGIVVRPDTVVRAAPSANADAYFEVAPGQRLELLTGGSAGWVHVKNPLDGRVGFLPANAFEKI